MVGKDSKWRARRSLDYIGSEETIKPQYAVERLYELTKTRYLYHNRSWTTSNVGCTTL